MKLFGITKKSTLSLFAQSLLFFVFSLSSLSIFFCSGNVQMMEHNEDHTNSAHQESSCSSGFISCSMNIFDHISSWQASFLSVIPSVTDLFSLLALASVLSFFFTQLFQTHKIPFIQRFLFYHRTHQEYPLFNMFSSLFSQGILHPKFHA